MGWGGRGQDNSVKKSELRKKNLSSAKHLHKILYHQATTNPKKIKELKTMPCYKYNLMRPSIGTINLANLKIMFSWRNRIYCKCKNFNANNIHNFQLKLYTCNSI